MAGPPWPPGRVRHIPGGQQREDRVGDSSLEASLEDAALSNSESQAKPKTKAFGEPHSLEKKARCFSLVRCELLFMGPH